MIAAIVSTVDEIYAHHVSRAMCDRPVVTYCAPPATAPFESNVCCSTFDCIAKQLAEESEEERLLREAQEYRRRNLGYLYRPKLIPRLLFILRVPPIVFQPCWSSRRWKSLT